eukprot:SAG31_NODE_8607_length_1421_cov_1.086233_1_plen_105_part_00
MHSGHLITLFSARNYFKRGAGAAGQAENNDGALLLVAPDDAGNMRVRPKRLKHRLVIADDNCPMASASEDESGSDVSASGSPTGGFETSGTEWNDTARHSVGLG